MREITPKTYRAVLTIEGDTMNPRAVKSVRLATPSDPEDAVTIVTLPEHVSFEEWSWSTETLTVIWRAAPEVARLNSKVALRLLSSSEPAGVLAAERILKRALTDETERLKWIEIEEWLASSVWDFGTPIPVEFIREELGENYKKVGLDAFREARKFYENETYAGLCMDLMEAS
jgi:hypothetical protein